MKESDIRPQGLFNRFLSLARIDGERLLGQRASFVQVACPGCGSSGQRPAMEKDGFTYVTCKECGTLYLSPRPSPTQLDTFYRTSESVRFWSTDFYRQTVEARREKMFRPRAQLVGEAIGRQLARGDLVFVDIGSGYGVFLEEVQRLGIFQHVMGLEPNPEMANICRRRGFAILQKSVEAVLPGEIQADCATSFEVLEHVFSPLEFLVASRCLLKPGGLLIFTTLTVSGFDIQLLWEHSKSVFAPHHLNFMSVKGMERLVERAQLKVIDLRTPGELDLDIVFNTAAENRQIVLPRFVVSLLGCHDAGVQQAFQDFLREHRMSSHIRVIATV